MTCVNPEAVIPALTVADIACFDDVDSAFADLFKQRQAAKRRHAIIISGRFTCQRDCLIPQIWAFLKAHPDQWIDVYLSINHEYDGSMPPPWVAGLNTIPYTIPDKYDESRMPGQVIRKGPITHVKNIMSMFAHNHIAFKMIDAVVTSTAGVQGPYTWVVKYRPDILQPRLPDMLSEEVPHPGVFIPQGCDYGGLNDRMAMGDMDSMRIYCDLINHVDEHYDRDQNYMIHPETMVLFHMAHSKIPVFRFPYDTANLNPARGLDTWK